MDLRWSMAVESRHAVARASPVAVHKGTHTCPFGGIKAALQRLEIFAGDDVVAAAEGRGSIKKAEAIHLADRI